MNHFIKTIPNVHDAFENELYCPYFTEKQYEEKAK
jgi:hypothetical protein